MRRITILHARAFDGGLAVRALLRLDVPPTLQTPAPLAQSVQKDVTPEELSALQSGSVVERFIEVTVPYSEPAGALAKLLQSLYADHQSDLDAQAPQESFTGASWDGSRWVGLVF